MALTVRQALLASKTLQDVFTPEEDAGTIANLGAYVVTRVDHEQWYPLAELDAGKDLLATEAKEPMSAPEMFNDMRVVASVKVASDPDEGLYHRYVIVTDMSSGGFSSFNTHVVAHNGQEWVGTTGKLDMVWGAALEDMVRRAKVLLKP